MKTKRHSVFLSRLLGSEHRKIAIIGSANGEKRLNWEIVLRRTSNRYPPKKKLRYRASPRRPGRQSALKSLGHSQNNPCNACYAPLPPPTPKSSPTRR